LHLGIVINYNAIKVAQQTLAARESRTLDTALPVNH
jgi:hypothetical protein